MEDMEAIIAKHPILDGLEGLCWDLRTKADGRNVTDSDANLILFTLQTFPATTHLPSVMTSHHTLNDDMQRLRNRVNRGLGVNLSSVIEAILAEPLDNALVWKSVYHAVHNHITPSAESIVAAQPSIYDWSLDTDLGYYHVDVPNVGESIFAQVETEAARLFEQCQLADPPLFDHGWKDWPTSIGLMETRFRSLIVRLAAMMGQFRRSTIIQTKDSEVDVGILHSLKASWYDVVVPGVLNSRSADRTEAFTKLAKHARGTFATQTTRRFVIGFTLCGSYMRLWHFDRAGCCGSDEFDIHTVEGGRRFIKAMLGFLTLEVTILGFDPALVHSANGGYMEITRKGRKEHLVLQHTMFRCASLVGRGTTCWMAHSLNNPEVTLVVKDSWQHRGHEGELLKEADEKGVTNVARYYHHEIVHVDGRPDDTDILRNGLNLEVARRVQLPQTPQPPNGQLLGYEIDSRSSVQKKMYNRTHHRLVVHDCGNPIYYASSPKALLTALVACINGHESLYRAGILHQDISINNLVISETRESITGFLIDLDIAVRLSDVASARRAVGTKAFMSIGVLRGEPPSFMHDLESFFWVLFLICIDFQGPGHCKRAVDTKCERWSQMDGMALSRVKTGIVRLHEFEAKATRMFTEFYAPLVGIVSKLKEVMFPLGKEWEVEKEELYTEMRQILLSF